MYMYFHYSVSVQWLGAHVDRDFSVSSSWSAVLASFPGPQQNLNTYCTCTCAIVAISTAFFMLDACLLLCWLGITLSLHR